MKIANSFTVGQKVTSSTQIKTGLFKYKNVDLMGQVIDRKEEQIKIKLLSWSDGTNLEEIFKHIEWSGQENWVKGLSMTNWEVSGK